mmetsp:Transcript_27364/g.38179  ORF Transcript_27364/g.38179 Transcript_27364/m.38179 type:complete len:292 (-) Transcript_27364:149-1024(-)
MAMSSLAVCYAKGVGVDKNQKKAFEYFKKAAEIGNPTDICNLGVCYKKGMGCEKDFKKAVELYKKAAKMGDAAALTNLGVCYFNGTGTPKDSAKAISYWKEAAELGNPTAKRNLDRSKKRNQNNRIPFLAQLFRVVKRDMNEAPSDEELKNGDKPQTIYGRDWDLNTSVLENPFFKRPMSELSVQEQLKRKNLAMEALELTLNRVQRKFKRDIAEVNAEQIKMLGATAGAKLTVSSSNPAESKSRPIVQRVEMRFLELMNSCQQLLKLLAEPKKRVEAPPIVKMKPVVMKR